MAEKLPRYGVTSFLPTIITSPLETIEAGQAVVTGGPPAGFRGARPLGLHVEGPFLNPAKKGAHNPKYLRAPDARRRGRLVAGDRHPAGDDGAGTAGRARRDRGARRRAACW